LRVQTSTSKAHNLNAAMQLVDTENVVIYDADHHPDPGSLMTLTSYMQVPLGRAGVFSLLNKIGDAYSPCKSRTV
jgi:cellulose synthase/poly-beta-1,6-N-acetylglucosamine synthase-like glycosyltransferase